MQGGVDGRYGRMTAATSSSKIFDDFVDPELNDKTHKVAEKVSENLNIIANDASLAFFRIQEHVRKTLPQLVDQKHEVQDIHKKVQGAGFDAEYATNAVKTMNGSATHFHNIQDLLKNAMFMKQQIDYEENRRKPGGTGMYSPKHSDTTLMSSPVSTTTPLIDSTDSSLGQSGHEQLPDTILSACPCSPKKCRDGKSSKNTTSQHSKKAISVSEYLVYRTNTYLLISSELMKEK
ncbi:hypothetical protein LOTGIDRAFT_230826 [Lottia gigantea]|uniref:BLOC-1-related complex subunit 8 n=1 Tax=Lottia gigantea TaxID=225164 RepID=V4B2J5_LOTGI|nr:hypothetical protein LOTGIDRAFT_230826 [Lottia gigantea]ESP00627.1 hypothetical protein LOTGIDRAFT_230826 [Lottia gigantea]